MQIETIWSQRKYECKDTSTHHNYTWILSIPIGRVLITVSAERGHNLIQTFQASISYWRDGWRVVIPKHDWFSAELFQIIGRVGMPDKDDKDWHILFENLIQLAIEIIDGD